MLKKHVVALHVGSVIMLLVFGMIAYAVLSPAPAATSGATSYAITNMQLGLTIVPVDANDQYDASLGNASGTIHFDQPSVAQHLAFNIGDAVVPLRATDDGGSLTSCNPNSHYDSARHQCVSDTTSSPPAPTAPPPPPPTSATPAPAAPPPPPPSTNPPPQSQPTSGPPSATAPPFDGRPSHDGFYYPTARQNGGPGANYWDCPSGYHGQGDDWKSPDYRCVLGLGIPPGVPCLNYGDPLLPALIHVREVLCGPPGSTFCAYEHDDSNGGPNNNVAANQFCNLAAGMTLAFGNSYTYDPTFNAGTTYSPNAFHRFTSTSLINFPSVVCDNSRLGGDPAPGIKKACWIIPGAQTPPPQPTIPPAAPPQHICSGPGTADCVASGYGPLPPTTPPAPTAAPPGAAAFFDVNVPYTTVVTSSGVYGDIIVQVHARPTLAVFASQDVSHSVPAAGGKAAGSVSWKRVPANQVANLVIDLVVDASGIDGHGSKVTSTSKFTLSFKPGTPRVTATGLSISGIGSAGDSTFKPFTITLVPREGA